MIAVDDFQWSGATFLRDKILSNHDDQFSLINTYIELQDLLKRTNKLTKQ